VLPIIRHIQAAGHTSLNAIAGQLKARKVATANGGKWRRSKSLPLRFQCALAIALSAPSILLRQQPLRLRGNWDSHTKTPRSGLRTVIFGGAGHDVRGLQPKIVSPRDIDIVVPLVLLDSGDIEEKLHFALLLSLRIKKSQCDYRSK
jgi:hypothetical protein